MRRLLRSTARVLIVVFVLIATLIGLGIGAIETSWGKDRLRELIVSQASKYLTARLIIGGLDGSILRDIQLHDVRLLQDDRELLRIDEISASYTLRELLQPATVIRQVRLLKPTINLSRLSDGRWDLSTVVKQTPRSESQQAPNRPIEVQSIDIVDGHVQVRGPLQFGALHAPTDYRSLNAELSIEYLPTRWRLALRRVSFDGQAPGLTLADLHGAIGNGPGGWLIEKLSVETPRTALIVDGRIARTNAPTRLGLTVDATRLAFQEWASVLPGLANIAVEGPLQLTLSGPLAQIVTDLELSGNGGAVAGRMTLDTTVPGWRATGSVDLSQLNLARWLNRSDRPSDITGHVNFDLALELGRRFPRGVFAFNGRHAMYLDFAADDVRAQGQITEKEVLISHASGAAYGATVDTRDATIGLETPFPFRFQGSVAQIDLRRLPAGVPVPHIESLLNFDYDITGRFAEPFIAGQATFSPSRFLGASIASGMVGTIDTGQTPAVYSGEGDIANVDLGRFGDGLGVSWLQEPRYVGSLAGRFRVDGRGFDTGTMTLIVGGQIARADLFGGTLTDADVSLSIHDGTLTASYSGDYANLNPAVPFDDERLEAHLTGNGTVSVTIRDLLRRNVTLDDYELAGALTLEPSTLHGIEIEHGHMAATVRDSQLAVAEVTVSGATIQGKGSGVLALDNRHASSFDYQINHVDVARVQGIAGIEGQGTVATTGRLSGPWRAVQFIGNGSIDQLDAFDVKALTISATYDATFDVDHPRSAVAKLEVRGTSLSWAGWPIEETSGTLALNDQQIRVDFQVLQSAERSGTIGGSARLRLDERAVDISQATLGLGRASWRMDQSRGAVTVSWSGDGIIIGPTSFVGGSGDERIDISGSWRADGAGALRLMASHVFLDTFQTAFDRPTRYGGVLDADLMLRGTRRRPSVAGTLSVTSGRIERVSYEKLAGRFDYVDDTFSVDFRLDQSPGIWVTAAGSVPMALLDRRLAEGRVDVAVKSSGINLGLLQGLTDQVADVSGTLTIDVRAIGTSRDPHFDGSVAIERAAFRVVRTGARYRNGRAEFRLSPDRIIVNAFHLEDSGGRPLEVRGSLGTHELTVGELEVQISATRFEVMRSELGRLSLDAKLEVGGRAESPQVTGDLTISSGGLKVDEILERALFQPYATEETPISAPEAVGVLNPWQRLNLNLALHVPNTLRLTGDNVQITQGTPIGLGNINLRVAGDLYLYKGAKEPMYVTGSFDSVSGTYAFQGRRFDVDPTSSIVFRGDLNPELYIGVTRTISGVQTRVGVIGPIRAPELRLTSVPPLDESDILSLIVFNTSTNNLSTRQQQELVARAGALAAGFIATPIISAISNEIGLDILEVEAGSDLNGGIGAKVTVGQEIAPGLVARFSRQFGPDPYDEASVEYYLSRIIRLRATFSDAQTLNARSPFRRVERAGIDLLFFFSF